MKADPRFNIYLKQLQDIMANEFMQILLESESPTNSSQSSKKEYESIADLVWWSLSDLSNTYLHQGLLYPSEVSWFFLNLNEEERFSLKDWSADFFEKNKLKKVTGRLNLFLWLYGQTKGEYIYENCEKLNKINKILHIWLADSFRRL